jgi:hypothetical protein
MRYKIAALCVLASCKTAFCKIFTNLFCGAGKVYKPQPAISSAVLIFEVACVVVVVFVVFVFVFVVI